MLVGAGITVAKALHHPALRPAVDVREVEHIAGVPDLVRSRGFTPVRY